MLPARVTKALRAKTRTRAQSKELASSTASVTASMKWRLAIRSLLNLRWLHSAGKTRRRKNKNFDSGDGEGQLVPRACLALQRLRLCPSEFLSEVLALLRTIKENTAKVQGEKAKSQRLACAGAEQMCGEEQKCGGYVAVPKGVYMKKRMGPLLSPLTTTLFSGRCERRMATARVLLMPR